MFFMQQDPIPKHTPAPPMTIIENISEYLQMPMSTANRVLAVIIIVSVVSFILFIMVRTIISIWRDGNDTPRRPPL